MAFLPKFASKTKQEGHDHLVCPNCGAEMCGGRIYEDWAPRYHPDDPAEQARYAAAYGAGPDALKERQARLEMMGPNAFSPEQEREYLTVNICGGKEIGIQLPYDHPDHYDGVSYWMFPCCGATYDRWTGKRVEDWKRDGD